VPYLRDVHGLGREHAADHITVMLLSFAVGSLFSGTPAGRETDAHKYKKGGPFNILKESPFLNWKTKR
ncbi:hypothetical protein, partial [Desulfosarcina sp.]|uniref:hypothetical protein n=1 Tax=Desulfosarcina sp. TaxID=2027861 RepID=UPI00356643F5